MLERIKRLFRRKRKQALTPRMAIRIGELPKPVLPLDPLDNDGLARLLAKVNEDD